MLNQKTIDALDEYKKQFHQAKPFRYVVVDDFFTPEFCAQLLKQFPDFNDQDAIDENQTVGRKAVVQQVPEIGRAYRDLDRLVQSQAFINQVEHITGIEGLLYDPHYIGGGTHNNLNGQELDPHVDFTHHPITSHHRRLNLIVYLNRQWSAEWGGQIQFHKNPRLSPDEDEIISVLPLFNRAVLFETHNHSWHGFPPISLPEEHKNLSRKSFALYYYTHQRAQPVDPHSTIYVERPLSERFQTGLKLNANDVTELQQMIGRRDQHLKRLYTTITAQTKELSRIKAEVMRLKAATGTPDKQARLLQRQMELLSFDESRMFQRIQELENSTSWRITAPLRQIKRWFRRRGSH
ncbi:2OG-Fe(II) oxygenase [Marinicella sediminis]|uniref:2OG-Fe(II) oxygenase n=1 Tax=Marinicella sediminis TaxID=1792834 RepID=A0ABV7JA02_9GAMM|nr:2OG-Fe(II) oxygenase [Marinicella sediminis]